MSVAQPACRRSVVAVALLLLWPGGQMGIDAQRRPASAVRRTATAAAPHANALAGAVTGSERRQLIDRYCVTCHNPRLRTANLDLADSHLDDVASSGADVWEKVVKKLRTGAMPPTGSPRPEKAGYDGLISGLEAELDRAALSNPNPGRSIPRRLNRTEYGNVISDLFSLDVNPELLLPPDDEDAGFDNMADGLSVSPTLMERYLAAARRIAQWAVGDPAIPAVLEKYNVPEALYQDGPVSDDLPLGSRGGIAVKHYFPLDGEYSIKISLRRSFYDLVRGIGNTPHALDVRVDGARVTVFSVGGAHTGAKPAAGYSGNAAGDDEFEVYAHHADDQLAVRFAAKAGLRTVAVAFIRKPGFYDKVLQPRPHRGAFGSSTDEMMDGNPAVRDITIGGPFHGLTPESTPSRNRIFRCQPKAGNRTEEDACAKQILPALARRAYRRPITGDDVAALIGFFDTGRRERGFEGGIQLGIERILADPEFLFRFEQPAAGRQPAAPVSDIELASRLSFFIWSRGPDDELLDVAASGRLRAPGMLDRQVRRMLADERAKALVTSFAAQWLQLRQLRNASPDLTAFPDFDENLRGAMQRETELFLDSQLRGDRSVLDLLRADYSFLNERLAQHYGVPDIYGPHFRRVTIGDENRRGLLGHGSILTLTSYPNRTSVVTRGKWVLDNLLAAPPPPPPPNVPALEEKSGEARSLRDRMEQHRRNPACAVCHRVMDPIGFALENFDAIGRWRKRDSTGLFDDPPAGETAGADIDPSGILPDGSTFLGPTGLRQLLLSRQSEFVGAVSEKLLQYALGRPLEYYDMPAVRRIVKGARAADNRWSALVLGIVNSTPFQMRRS